MSPADVSAEWVDAGMRAVIAQRELHGPISRREIVRHALAAVLPDVQAQALRAAAVDLTNIADTVATEAGSDLLVMAAAESTRGDARLLRSMAARLTATTEEPTDG